MTVIDFRRHWEARRRAEGQDREGQEEAELEEVRRALEAWTPVIEEWIEAERAQARLRRGRASKRSGGTRQTPIDPRQ